MEKKQTAILGAGGWGTALAALWAKDGRDVVLWGHNTARVEQLRSSRENKDYLPGFKLPDNVRVTSDLKDCEKCSLVVFVSSVNRVSRDRRTNARQNCDRCSSPELHQRD